MTAALRTPRPTRRSRITIVVVTAVVAVVSGLLSAAGSWALWSQAFTNPSLQAAAGPQAGISLARVGGAASAATGPASVLTATLGRSDAQTLLATSGRAVAIPLVVRMRADGHAGMTYDIALPAFVPGTLFAASTVRLFPLSSTTDAAALAACTPAAAPAVQPPTTDIVGIAAGVDPSAPGGTAVDYWCLAATYNGSGGTYQNTATVQGTAPSGAVVSGQSTWHAFLVSPGTYSLTHEITLPGAP